MKTKLKLIFSIIILILSIILIIKLGKLGILPTKYLLLFILVIIILNIGLILLLLSKKIVLNIIGIILGMLIIFADIIGINISTTAANIINKTFKPGDDYVEYDLVVLKDSKYKDINDLENTDIGIYKLDQETNKLVIETLKNEISVKEKMYNLYNQLKEDLIDYNISGIFINSGVYELMNENDKEFYSQTKVIKKIYINMEDKEEIHESDILNIYISGIDTYGEISNVSRSDVNIIMTVNAKTHEVLLTTIPRDTYVQLSGTSGLKDKLTHAGIYGINMSKRTIENFLDIDITNYIRVNFNSVVELVDEIGGIDINNDVAFTRRGRYFAVGMIHLNGKEALIYSRERKLMPQGDYTRGEHQEKVIAAIIDKISKDQTVLLNYERLMDELSNFFETDIDTEIFKKYVKDQINYMPSWNVNSISIKGIGASAYTYSIPQTQLYVSIPEEESVIQASKLINGIIEGKMYNELNN